MDGGLNPTLVSLMDKGFREIRETMAVEADKASESRRTVHEQLEASRASMIGMANRMENVENGLSEAKPLLAEIPQLKIAMDAAKPTLEEVAIMKAKDRETRRLIKILWTIGVVILSTAGWIVHKYDGVLAAIRALSGR